MLQKLFIISFGVSMVLCRHVQFFRKDYTYFVEFDAFYKLHAESNLDWYTAFFKCTNEGSQLFYPKAPEEWRIVNTLIEAQDSLSFNFTSIYVGIRNEGIEDFITVDGNTTPFPLSNYEYPLFKFCTTMNIQTGLLSADNCRSLALNQDSEDVPFVCKKVEDISCPTVDREYKYVKENKKCYKVNKIKQTWQEALNTCVMEGGLLASIENEMEADILKKIISTDEMYHAGFRMIPPSTEYYTLKGKHIKDTYSNFYDRNENFIYGSIYNSRDNLYLRTQGHDEKYQFVCEMEV